MSDETSKHPHSILTALVAIQAAVEQPKKKAENPHFKKKYADLTEVLECLHAPLTEHGLGVMQVPISSDKGAGVRTSIFSKSGEVLDCGELMLPLERNGPQAVGIAITYARRYSLMAIFRLSAEDDDGEGAEGRGKQGKAPPARKTLDDVAGYDRETGEVSQSARPLASANTTTQARQISQAKTAGSGESLPTDPSGLDEYGLPVPKSPCPKVMRDGPNKGKLWTALNRPVIELMYKDRDQMTSIQREWAEYLIQRHACRKAAEGETT